MNQQLNVRVPMRLFEKLRAKAALEGRSVTSVITSLVIEYIESDVQPSPIAKYLGEATAKTDEITATRARAAVVADEIAIDAIEVVEIGKEANNERNDG